MLSSLDFLQLINETTHITSSSESLIVLTSSFITEWDVCKLKSSAIKFQKDSLDQSN